MRELRIHGYGGAEVLRLDEVEKPVPGKQQVLVRVRAASVNPIDWKMRKGLLAGLFPLSFPRTLGRDCAGEVGINLAIQDAVAAANILAAPLLAKNLSTDDLKKVQRQREWPVRATQRLQLLVQNRIIARVLRADERLEPPLVFRLLSRFAWLRRLPGRLIGMGLRPEHVRTTAAAPVRAPQGTKG